MLWYYNTLLYPLIWSLTSAIQLLCFVMSWRSTGLEIKHETSGVRRTRKNWKFASPSMDLGVTKIKRKKAKKKMFMRSQFWHSRCTLLTFLDCMSALLSKKGSTISVPCVVHELPLLMFGVTRTPCQLKSRSPAQNLGAADSQTPANFEPCLSSALY